MKSKYIKAITVLTGCGIATGNKPADKTPNQNQTQSNTEEKTHFYYILK